MSKLKASDILENIDCTYVAGNKDVSCEGCVIDSRQVTDKSMFVAFNGENLNANKFVDKAIDDGASILVVTDDISSVTQDKANTSDCCIIRCKDDDAQQFMLDCAKLYRALNKQWKVVCVTGSVGKTTTKEMCACAVASQKSVTYTKGNYNNLIGMPMTLLSAKDTDDILVLETGMNHFNELRQLSNSARPDIALITNIGTSHIGILGSKENIARSKAEILESMDEDGVLGLTSFDEYSSFIKDTFATPKGINVVHVGNSNKDDIWVEDVKLNEDGCASFKLMYKDGDVYFVELGLPGKAIVSDFELAMVVVDSLGLDRAIAIKAIENMKSSAMRLEVEQNEGTPRIINDTYNASPTSMAEALDVLSAMECKGKRICVLGEMGEMGDEAPLLHSLVGAYAAAKPIDMLCTIGDSLAECIVNGARGVGMSEDKIVSFNSVDEALKVLKPVLEEDDLVLVKASRAAELENFSKGVLS